MWHSGSVYMCTITFGNLNAWFKLRHQIKLRSTNYKLFGDITVSLSWKFSEKKSTLKLQLCTQWDFTVTLMILQSWLWSVTATAEVEASAHCVPACSHTSWMLFPFPFLLPLLLCSWNDIDIFTNTPIPHRRFHRLHSYIMEGSEQYMTVNKLSLRLWVLIRPGSQ